VRSRKGQFSGGTGDNKKGVKEEKGKEEKREE
jgi:hypothetical protein